MNYRHAYHAGNFADVFKHIVLTMLVEKLQEKEKPFCVLDSHAGTGLYSFNSTEAQKTLEYESGVTQLFAQKNLDPLFKPYMDLVRSFNTHSADGLPIIHYPGSPLIIQRYLREQDRLLANELHKDDFRKLEMNCEQDPCIKLFKQDAYTWINAELPPLEKRGLTLIDPPYETPDEMKKLNKTIRGVYSKFSHGMYAIWFPIKLHYPIQHFYQSLKTNRIKNVLAAELCLHPCTDPDRLNGCGLVLINPPWQLEEKLKVILPQLLDCFSRKGYGKWMVEQIS